MIGIGIDIGGTFVKFFVTREDGTVLKQEKVETDKSQGMDGFIRQMAAFINQIKNQFAPEPVVVGIGAPGDVDPINGLLRYMPNLQFKGTFPWPLADQLEQATAIRPIIANDATLAAWGVYQKDLNCQGKNVLVVTLGTGVGGGLILNGQLYQGSHGSAGEIGHVKISDSLNAPLCGCGAQGCLEAYAGTIGIRRRILESVQNCPNSILAKLVKEHPNFKLDIAFKAAQQGCAQALKIWQDTGHYLGIGIANFALILDMDTVVLTGGVSGAFDFFKDALFEVLNKQSIRTPFAHLQIKTSQTPNVGGLGAALYALNQFR